MAEPPVSEGASHNTVRDMLPAVTVLIVGAPSRV